MPKIYWKVFNMKHPDAKKHRDLSFVKSGLRIVGCLAALFGAGLVSFAVAFLLAEIVGVYEEMV